MYRKVTRIPNNNSRGLEKKIPVKEGDKLISFENERGQLVVVTLEQALDKWEENTRDLGRTIKEFREGFKKSGERLR